MNFVQLGGSMEYLLREVRRYQGKDFRDDDPLILDDCNDEVIDMALQHFSSILEEEKDEIYERNVSLLFATLDQASSLEKYKSSIGLLADKLSNDVQTHPERKILTLINLYNLVLFDETSDLGPRLFLSFLTVAEKSPNRSGLLKGRLSSLKATVKKWRLKSHTDTKLEQQIYYAAYKVAKQVGDAKDSMEFLMEFLSLHDPKDKSDSVLSEAAQAVLTALSAEVDIESVFRLSLIPAVQALKSSQRHAQLYQLFEILLKGTAEDLKQFCSSSKVMVQLSIPEEKVWKNIRLLTLCSLGRTPGTHTFSELKHALVLDDELEMEDLIVQAVQKKLVDAKIDSACETVHIYRAAHRCFDRSQWELILKSLKRVAVNEREVLKAL